MPSNDLMVCERTLELLLQESDYTPGECVQRRGEEVLLYEDPGQYRKRRYALVLDFYVY